MSDANESTTEQTPSLESQLLASLDKGDSGKQAEVKAPTEAKAPDTDEAKPEVTETASAETTEAKAEPEKEADEEAEESEEELDPEFLASAEKHKIPTSLDDIPEEARPLVEKKLKDMQAGFTRAMQEAREYRKTELQLKQDVEYRTKHPDQWLADFIQQNPDVIDKVNQELEKRADPTYAEAQKMKREAAADRAQVDADRAEKAMAAREQRAEEVENYVTASASKSGIPVALVEDAIAAAILAKPLDQRDISEAEIDAIIEAKAKVYRKSVAGIRGAKTREYAKEKAADAKGTVIPPKTAVGSESQPAKKPANLEEAMHMALDRMGAVA